MKKVAILMGGISKEREISLKTGRAISDACKRLGFEVIDIDVGKDIIERLLAVKPDVALLALHGQYGEDGCIQGMLEVMDIPYTGSGVLGSAVGMDKAVCRMVAKEIGIPVPKGKVFHKNEKIDSFIDHLGFDLPVVVKPSREGSTINISIVHEKSEFEKAIKAAFNSDTKVLVEEYVKGTEITVGIVAGEALTALEVVPKSGFYDFESKYTKGKTEYIVPARIDDKIAEKVKKDSANIFKAIDCSGIARADFIVKEDGSYVFLEINTMPGMTELSLVPKAANHDGISFDDIVSKLIESASVKEVV